MKIPYFAVVVAAGLVQVSATPAPIRLEILEPESAPTVAVEPLPHILPYRFGLATAPQDAKAGHKLPFAVIRVGGAAVAPVARKRPGCGRFKAQAIRVSNSLRKALGMPLIKIEEYKLGNGVTVGKISVTHFPTPHLHPEPHPHHPHRHHHHPPGRHGHGHGHIRIMEEPFAVRLHFALSTLGPWEGRAVAFVLGCGIGVLLRMLWVLAVISYRLIRGSREQEFEYQHILFEEQDAEDILVAPPTYVLVDEKTALVIEEEKKDSETN